MVLDMLRALRRAATVVLLGGVMATQAVAQSAGSPSGASELPLFAVEIRTGPGWDRARSPQDQAFFKEHSANLRRMREAGLLVMGARYADKGLVVVAAASVADVKAQMDQDPSIGAGTFAYEIHPFNVFYGGELKSRTRR